MSASFAVHAQDGGAIPGAPAGDDSTLPKIDLKSFATHTRLILPVDSGVEGVLKSTAKGFELLLKEISLIDIGIPFGAENAWLARLNKLNDERLASVTARETTKGVLIEGEWRFPKGDLAPADPGMDVFDFRTRTPVAYVVDFWPKKGPTIAEVRRETERKRQKDAVDKARDDANRRIRRRIASIKRQADVADTGKYCNEPLADERDVFLPFRPARSEIDFGRWFSRTTPDTDYPYLEPKAGTDDAQYLTLALDLYRKGKSALAVRTAEFFEKEHPKSQYMTEMKFLKANALIKLAHQDRAERVLRELIVDAKGTPAALHAGMYAAAKTFADKSYLQSLENFLWLNTHYSEHRLNWVFHLGAAESMYHLRQTEKASKEYQWVIEHGTDKGAQAEAALRLGDLYLEIQQPAQALAAYYKALKYFGDEADRVPTVLLNRSESLYLLGQWDRAEKAFEEFLKKHPSHPSGWRATFRLGEIAGRKAGAAFAEESRKRFYETINRYPTSPGANLARVRLLPCGDHGGYSYGSARSFLEGEATRYDGMGEVFVENYSDLVSLSYVRTLVSMGREEEAIQMATDRIHATKTEKTRGVLAATASIALRKRIEGLLESGQAYRAIVFFRKYDWVVPADGDPVLFDFMLKLARESADLGMGTYSRILAEKYAKLDPLLRETGRLPASGAIRQATQDLDVEDRLKVSEASFTQAKALWVESRSADAARIQGLLGAVAEESRFALERELILGLIEEAKPDYAAALKHAIQAEMLGPKSDARTMARISYWIARLHAASGAEDVALRLYSRLEKAADASTARAPAESRWEALGLPDLPGREALVFEQTRILERKGDWSGVSATFGRAVESGISSNRVLYGYARALFKSGDTAGRKGGLAALKRIVDNGEEDFWKKLAKDSLESEKFVSNGAGIPAGTNK